MAHYSTTQIVRAAQLLNDQAKVTTKAGDYAFSKSITIALPDTNITDYIYIVGFTTEPDGLPKDDEVSVEKVELRTLGADDNGGVVTPNEAVLRYAHRLSNSLVAMGHAVVRSSDGYF